MVALRERPEVFLDRYEVQELVGSGNQGAVHRALDRVTGETVALKRWRGEISAEAKAGFQVDARTIARLAGPGIVGYRSFGVAGQQPFLAMEWVPGGRLSDRLARGRLSMREALDATKRVARGLARMHRAGLAHRDVKPSHVLLPEGALWCAKLGDAWLETSELVRAGFGQGLLEAMIGYMSPQVFGKGMHTGGPRDDVYSLGAMVFRCVSGCMPFPEHDRPSLSNAIPKSRTPRSLGDVTRNVPEGLVDLVDRMLSDDPERRPADAVEPCFALHEHARTYGSYDSVFEADITPGKADIPPHFEVREERTPEVRGAAEPEIEVDPEALRGPFVILDPPLYGEPVTVPPREIRLSPGAVVAGRFEIEEAVGEGSTGVVYKARDCQSRDTVALRILDGAASRREIKRFLGDAAKHAQRYHPRIVRVLHRGTIAGRMFVAMDWIGGETLAARMEREALPMQDAVTVIRGLVEALELVHTMGLVQGNLRPGHVFLRNREVEWTKLGDIAVWRESPLVPEVPIRDLVYVAPELARTGKVSARGDLYALGVIAYRLLTGALPFEAKDAEELAAARWAPAPPLAEARPDAGRALCRLVDELLQKDPAKRPHNGVVAAGWLNTRYETSGW